MKIEQIRQVIMVASTGSINKAAQQLYITQPNLSKSIQLLEDELKNKIFERTGKGVELTTFGHQFLAYAQPSYEQFKFLENFCSDISQSPAITLSVSSQYIRFANALFIEICNKYKDKNINFYFNEDSSQNIIEKVHSQETELGIIVFNAEQKQLLMYQMKSYNIEYNHLTLKNASVIIGNNNPLYNKTSDEVSVEELKPYPFVNYKDAQFNFMSRWEQSNIYNNFNKIIVSDRATMYEFLENTSAYTIGFHSYKAYNSTQYYKNIRALTLKDFSIVLEVGWIKSCNRPLSSIAEEYIEMLNKIAKE